MIESSRMITCLAFRPGAGHGRRRVRRRRCGGPGLRRRSSCRSRSSRERRKSVTSSGRSSTRSRMRWVSGELLRMESARSLSRTVLPVRGGATIRPRWPRPSGAMRSMARRRDGFALGVLEDDALGGMQRREMIEIGWFPSILRPGCLDGEDPVDGHEFFPVARRPNAGREAVAIAEKVLALDLPRDVDVLGQGAEVVARPAQETACPAGRSRSRHRQTTPCRAARRLSADRRRCDAGSSRG